MLEPLAGNQHHLSPLETQCQDKCDERNAAGAEDHHGAPKCRRVRYALRQPRNRAILPIASGVMLGREAWVLIYLPGGPAGGVGYR